MNENNENLADLLPLVADGGNHYSRPIPAPGVHLLIGMPPENLPLGGAPQEIPAQPAEKPMVRLRRVEKTGGAPQALTGGFPNPKVKLAILTETPEILAEIDVDYVPWLRDLIKLVISRDPIIPPMQVVHRIPPPPAFAKPGPKGRAVRVVIVDPESDQPHKVGDMFDNASQASRSVGLPPNSLCMAMRGTEGLAKLRGVTFQYEDDYQHEINGEGRASD